MLESMMIAQATLHAAGVKSAMPHFIAIVKELEEIYGFTFEKVELEDGDS